MTQQLILCSTCNASLFSEVFYAFGVFVLWAKQQEMCLLLTMNKCEGFRFLNKDEKNACCFGVRVRLVSLELVRVKVRLVLGWLFLGLDKIG